MKLSFTNDQLLTRERWKIFLEIWKSQTLYFSLMEKRKFLLVSIRLDLNWTFKWKKNLTKRHHQALSWVCRLLLAKQKKRIGWRCHRCYQAHYNISILLYNSIINNSWTTISKTQDIPYPVRRLRESTCLGKKVRQKGVGLKLIMGSRRRYRAFLIFTGRPVWSNANWLDQVLGYRNVLCR